MPALLYNQSVAKLKGIGPAKAELLKDTVGVDTVEDLLYYFPRRYVDRSLTGAGPVRAGDQATLILHVTGTYLAHGRRSRLLVQTTTPQGDRVTLVWFRGHQYMRSVFQNGQTLIVSGKVEYYQGLQIAHPDFEFLDEDDEQALLHVGRIIPVYPSGEALKKKSLDSRGFRRLLGGLVGGGTESPSIELPELLPVKLRERHDLPPRIEALRQIHYPEDQDGLDRARRYFKYEELYLFHLLMLRKMQLRRDPPRLLRPLEQGKSEQFTALLQRLPFQLTGEQERVIEELLAKTTEEHAAAVLLQGDVGSGKTVVALAVALHYMEAGIQVAMMAPTEVLARQHYNTISGLLGLGSLQVELLTGSAKSKARKTAVDRIARGEADLVIGTHSLIEESVVWKRLGLVIIDEQHRFGVEQREQLRAHGDNPDVIAMTATPIPRTLSLTAFADLDLVTLREKPAGRRPIQTMWLQEDRRAGVYKSIRKHVSNGRQCYIVYPVIGESEKLDLKNATAAYEELKTGVFPEFEVALLHGRLKAADKDRIMDEFRGGRVQILCTTSVIEVGVDVPNATVIVIEHADRFGISQLHQLRGRVGRGAEDSFCVLMSDAEVTEEAVERLTALSESEDGFYLAEIDMKIRGPGELLGLRQHGLPGFRVADLYRDRKLAEAAHADAREFPEITEDMQRIMRLRWAEAEEVAGFN